MEKSTLTKMSFEEWKKYMKKKNINVTKEDYDKLK